MFCYKYFKNYINYIKYYKYIGVLCRVGRYIQADVSKKPNASIYKFRDSKKVKDPHSF